jgi:hypothetical protein
MTTKTIELAPTPRLPPPRGKLVWPAPAHTTADRVQRIQALGECVEGYVRFMCQAGNANGVSDNANEKAIEAFYEQMVVLERQLGRIHDNFQLE